MKLRPPGGKEPGEAHDVEAIEQVLHMDFGGRFRTAVSVDRVQRHPFFVSFRAAAAEDFVGADVQQLAAEFLSGEGHVLCAQAVDFVSQFRVFGAAIDVGHGGGVDDESGAVGGNGRFHPFPVRYITLWQIKADEFVAGQSFPQRCPQLAFMAGD